MNSYDQIKKLLVQKDFQSAILLAFSNSLKFKLTSKINNQETSSSIDTTIDLLKGIKTQVSEDSILDNETDLMKFHNKQLEKVHDIWDSNRKILITILELLASNDNLDITNLETSFSDTNFTKPEVEQNPENFNNNVDNIVDLLLEDNDDSVATTADQSEAEEEIMATAEKQKIQEESWDEFMDDLSAEEEAVTEEVIVNETSSDEEIDDWSEWLGNEESTQEDWQEEEIVSNRQ